MRLNPRVLMALVGLAVVGGLTLFFQIPRSDARLVEGRNENGSRQGTSVAAARLQVAPRRTVAPSLAADPPKQTTPTLKSDDDRALAIAATIEFGPAGPPVPPGTGWVAGTVFEGDGPVHPGNVALWLEGDPPAGSRALDRRGAFLIGGIRESGTYSVLLKRDHRAEAWTRIGSVFVQVGQGSSIDLRLDGSRTLAGGFFLPEMPDNYILTVLLTQSGPDDVHATALATTYLPDLLEGKPTDRWAQEQRGEFAFADLRPGEYTLWAHLSLENEGMYVRADVDLRDGDFRFEPIPIRLEQLQSLFELTLQPTAE